MVLTLPNYSFLQLEDVNQTLYNYSRQLFDDWFEVDLKYLIEETGLTGDFEDVRYDFVLVSRYGNRWTFEVVNSFWTGCWKIVDQKGNLINHNTGVYYYDVNDNIVEFTSASLPNYKVLFQLSPLDTGRTISTNPIYFKEGSYNETTQFNITTNLTVTIIDKHNNPVEGATVKMLPLDQFHRRIPSTLEDKAGYNYIKSSYGMTGADGSCKIRLEKTPTPILQDCILEATYNGEVAYTYLRNDRVQQYTRDVEIALSDGSIKPITDLWMYKGEIKNFQFKVIPKNKYGVGYTQSIGKCTVDVYHTFDENQNVPNIQQNVQKLKTVRYTVTTNDEGVFTLPLSSRGFYGDKSQIKIVLPETRIYDSVVSDTMTIKHHWFYANDYEHLRSECESSTGCDAIILRNRVYNRNNFNYIKIKRKQYILGEMGADYPTLNSNHYKDLFMVTKGKGTNKDLLNELTLIGIKITNANNTIIQDEYTNVSIVGCVFEGCQGVVNRWQGAVIYQKTEKCSCVIQNSFFVNNYCNCIAAKGTVYLIRNLFKVTDVRYTPKQEPIILNQFSGRAVLKYNMIYSNTSMEYADGEKIIKSHPATVSNAKISVYCGRDAVINGRNAYELMKDNSLAFFDNPYNNQAYLFSIYYDHYSHKKKYIVACATNDYTRNKATGHTVEGSNQIYKNGYTLIDEKSKLYDDTNPFIHIDDGKIIEHKDIYVPKTGGIIKLNTSIPITKSRMG